MKSKLLIQVYQVLCDLKPHLLCAPLPTICVRHICLFSIPKTFQVNLYLRVFCARKAFPSGLFSWVVPFCHLDLILNVISSELLSSTTQSSSFLPGHSVFVICMVSMLSDIVSCLSPSTKNLSSVKAKDLIT